MAGAYSIARAIILEASRAGLSGNLDNYRQLAAPACPCIANEMKYIASYVGKGHLSGGQASHFKLIAYKQVSPAISQVFISYDAASTVLKDASGTVLGRSQPEKDREDVITLMKSANAWLVTSINPLEGGGK